jgi:hypothetical protein
MVRPAVVTTVPSGIQTEVTYNGSVDAPVNAGTYAIEVFVDDQDYSGTAGGSLIIEKAPLSATANDLQKGYGETNPAPTVSYSGFVNSETIAVIDQLPAISTSVNLTMDAGEYPIELSGGLDNNYSIVLHNGVFSVGKANQLITFDAIGDKLLNESPLILVATSSSGLPVSFEVVSGNATVAGDVLTLTNAGEVRVSATQQGNHNFNPASEKQTFRASILTGVETNMEANIKLYPNPASKVFTIYLPDDIREASITIVDSKGQSVLTTTSAAESTHDIHHLAPGLYLVRIRPSSTSGMNADVVRKLVVR